MAVLHLLSPSSFSVRGPSIYLLNRKDQSAKEAYIADCKVETGGWAAIRALNSTMTTEYWVVLKIDRTKNNDKKQGKTLLFAII